MYSWLWWWWWWWWWWSLFPIGNPSMTALVQDGNMRNKNKANLLKSSSASFKRMNFSIRIHPTIIHPKVTKGPRKNPSPPRVLLQHAFGSPPGSDVGKMQESLRIWGPSPRGPWKIQIGTLPSMVVSGSPFFGGRWHIIPQLAVNTTYIPLIIHLYIPTDP